ncbi:hypothetical protein ACTHHL_09245 [Aeribacillus composti]|uniref:LytR family transcriptional regulator n=1 Tax=Aeribacillus composti TaxID=1868734 RepID=UPI002E1CA6F5|nr:LytR family transcriptional regulator [Aeribacillus composti]MED0747396.1 LytR family transcriptional regulator [Aeribacillus composti]
MEINKKLPKCIKKAVRYINQDVNTIEKLDDIKDTLDYFINRRKNQMKMLKD